MTELTRRGFLELIGLGGIALTAPKPLKIVAATLEQLAAPPLHVGYCEMGPFSDARQGTTFLLQKVAFRAPAAMSLERWRGFHRGWHLCLGMRPAHSDDKLTMFLRAPIRYVSQPEWAQALIPLERRDDAMVREYVSPAVHAYRWPDGVKAEVWIVPGELDDEGDDEATYEEPLRPAPPRVPFPGGLFIVSGMILRPERRETLMWHCWSEMRAVRLDADKAAELGISAPDVLSFESAADEAGPAEEEEPEPEREWEGDAEEPPELV